MLSLQTLARKAIDRLGIEVRRRPGRPGPHANWLEKATAIRGGVSKPKLRALYRLAKACREGCIIEVGSYKGRSTVALAYGSLHGAGVPVYAIEPHEEFEGVFGGHFGPRDRADFFRAMLRTKGWKAVRLVNLSSEVVVSGWRTPVGLLWIDGDHSYEGVSRDFRCWEPHLTPAAKVAFDDVHEEVGGVKRFVDELLSEGWVVRSNVGRMQVLSRSGSDSVT